MRAVIYSYQDVTGKKAGMPTSTPKNEKYWEKSPEPRNINHPWAAEKQVNFSRWLLDAKVSKGNINKLLKDPSLKDITRPLCGAKNADEWYGKLEAIPWGIEDDDWTCRSFAVESAVDKQLKPVAYDVYFRDIVKVIKFLMGHKPFEKDLTYAPVKAYKVPKNATDDEDAKIRGEQVWHEMHTGSWWWEVQNELEDEATVVPVVPYADKTMMTAHQGGLQLHPVYATIGNLDRATRMSQTRPAYILLGLIPVVHDAVKEHGENFQSRLYHRALTYMFERMFKVHHNTAR